MSYFERGTTGIQTSDPDAKAKITAKIAELEALQDRMKQANIHARKGDSGALADMGFDSVQIHNLITPKYAYEKPGFQSWELTNNSQNIARYRKRLADIDTLTSVVEEETRYSEGVTLYINRGLERVQILFSGKPADEVRRVLKNHAFKWAPSQQAWQRQLTPNAIASARQALKIAGFIADTAEGPLVQNELAEGVGA